MRWFPQDPQQQLSEVTVVARVIVCPIIICYECISRNWDFQTFCVSWSYDISWDIVQDFAVIF